MKNSEVILVTGGARSGKSAYAEELARQLGGEGVVYLATAAICDEEMEARVQKHRSMRPSSWKTIEAYQNFGTPNFLGALQGSDAILLDCMGFMLNNLMYDRLQDRPDPSVEEMDQIEQQMCNELTQLIHTVREAEIHLIVVTNEVGMGLVPADRTSRYYRDILGRANRLVAAEANRVFLLMAGISMQLK